MHAMVMFVLIKELFWSDYDPITLPLCGNFGRCLTILKFLLSVLPYAQ